MAYLGLLLLTLLACSLTAPTTARHLITRTVTPKKAIAAIDASYSTASKPALKGINRLASSLGLPRVSNDPIGPAAEEESGSGSTKDAPGKGQGSIYWPGIKGYDGPMQYNGGSVKVTSIDVHILFYGDWSKYGGKDQKVITNFVESLSDDGADNMGNSVHKWWNILSKYTNSEGKAVSKDVKLGQVVVIDQDYRKGLNDLQTLQYGVQDDVFTLVSHTITKGLFPLDPEALYVVMTSADIMVGQQDANYSGGFCQGYCGYHYFGAHNNEVNITYALIGDPMQCPDHCTKWNNKTNTKTVSEYSGPDMAITLFAHELAEAATDPVMDGWYTAGNGWENGDVCAWVFKDDNKDPKVPIMYNMHGINDYKYLVQTLPNPVTNKCIVNLD